MNILYEDTALVVLDKPAGLTSEEGVPAALRQRWGRPDAYVGVIHRLDTGVSGLMVYARTPGAAAALTKQVTESQQAYAILDGRAEAGPGAPAQPCFRKTYRAVIAGGPDEGLPPEGILRDYLFKDSRKGRVFPVKRPRKGVREAVLEYRIVETAPDGSLSLAEITLHTGRTHQLRVHFAHIGHPLCGDEVYGRAPTEHAPIGRQALHCLSLSFPVPFSTAADRHSTIPPMPEPTVPVNFPSDDGWMHTFAPLPPDMEALLRTAFPALNDSSGSWLRTPTAADLVRQDDPWQVSATT